MSKRFFAWFWPRVERRFREDEAVAAARQELVRDLDGDVL